MVARAERYGELEKPDGYGKRTGGWRFTPENVADYLQRCPCCSLAAHLLRLQGGVPLSFN